MNEGIQVRLISDLTKYHPALKPGIEGVTAGQTGLWSRGNDNFVGVRFLAAGTFDVLWSGLEIIDSDFLRRQSEAQAKKWEALKSAKNVKKVLGPRGALKYVSYEYVDHTGMHISASQGFREPAQELLAFFEAHDIPIQIERLGRRGQ